MGYWQTKVLPKIKKVFETKTSTKKAAAAEACKSFDESKEEITREFEEKKAELHAKVIELYEACSAEIKTLVKERKESGLKKYSAAVLKFLEELAKIEFPGSKPVSEASSKYGPAYVSGPVFFVFEKVSTFIVTEEKVEPPLPAEAAKTEEETSGGVKEKEIAIEGGVKEKEIVIEEEKKEEVVEEKKEEVVEEKKEVVVVEEKEEQIEKPKPTEPDAAAEAPPPKVEESAAAEPPKP